MNLILKYIFPIGLSVSVTAQQIETEWRRDRALEMSKVVQRVNDYALQYLCDHDIEEDIEMRRYFRGDVDGDGLTDILLATSFSPPEGNFWNHDFILAFGDKTKPTTFLNFGGKGIRSFSDLSIGSSGILITALYYEAGDGLCCPGREQKLILIPTDDGWIEEMVPESTPGEVLDEYRYRVGTGDTLSMIARRAGIGLIELMDLNTGIDPRRLQVGDILCIKAVNK